MRKLFVSGAVAAGAVAVAIAGAGPAAAATATGGTERSSQFQNRGLGQAESSASATGLGRIEAEATARGGRGLPLLGLGNSSASGGGSVERFFDAPSDGTYRVTITYVDAEATATSTGQAAGSVTTTSVASFTTGFQTEPAPVIEFGDLTEADGTFTEELLVRVPEGEGGRIWVKGDVTASVLAQAKPGAAADARASVEQVRFTVEHVG